MGRLLVGSSSTLITVRLREDLEAFLRVSIGGHRHWERWKVMLFRRLRGFLASSQWREAASLQCGSA